MKATVAERQGGDREVEAERSRRQTVGRRNTNWQRGQEWRTSVRVNVKSKSIAATRVEPDGTRGKFRVLLREICAVRTGQKSAEAVVARIAIERWQERRAEGTESRALWSITQGEKPAQTSADRSQWRNSVRTPKPRRLERCKRRRGEANPKRA